MMIVKYVVVFFTIISITRAQFFSNFDAFVTKFSDPKNNVSERCHNQFQTILDEDLSTALKMFDASTKIPEGVANGRLYHLGSYDECINIKFHKYSEAIYGKYCLGTIPISVLAGLMNFDVESSENYQQRALANDVDKTGLHTAICIPHGCSAKDVSLSFINFTSQFCSSRGEQEDLTVEAIVTIALFGVILLIAIISTIYDIYLCYTKQTSRHDILIAFSMLTNGRKLFRSSKNPDQLSCLNGVKAISMMWVLLGHQYANFMMTAPLENYFDLQTWEQDLSSMFVIGATVSVDTFLLSAGLVTAYSFLKTCGANKSKFNLPLYYLHRYLRLTPAFAFIILFQATLLKFVADGPLWPNVDATLGKPCREHWWSALLYIQNYVSSDATEQCLPQSWYLNVDMQLFLLSPLVLLPLKRWPKYTLYSMYALVVVGIIVPFVLGMEYDIFGMTILGNPDQMQLMNSKYYDQTYARFAPYVIGMVDGYFLYKIKRSELILKLNRAVLWSLWIVSLAGLVACLYAGNVIVTSGYDKWSNALYLAFNRPAWSLGISFVIVSCIAGYGGPVNDFLSLPIFQLLTKLSYSMYLVHFFVIMGTLASWRDNLTFSNFLAMYMYWGTFMITLGLSLILCLLFESPVIVLEKLMFQGPSKAQKKNTETQVAFLGKVSKHYRYFQNVS